MILNAIQKQIESEYGGRPLAEIEAAVERTGMEAAGFRLPVCGDTFLNTRLRAERADMNFSSLPRLILRPRPLRRILLEETGEVRMAVEGEYISDGRMPPWPLSFMPNTYHYHIWMARELKPGETLGPLGFDERGLSR